MTLLWSAEVGETWKEWGKGWHIFGSYHYLSNICRHHIWFCMKKKVTHSLLLLTSNGEQNLLSTVLSPPLKIISKKSNQIFSEETFQTKAINMLINSMQVRIVHLVLALGEIYIYEIYDNITIRPRQNPIIKRNKHPSQRLHCQNHKMTNKMCSKH